jgi:hypothetical protein
MILELSEAICRRRERPGATVSSPPGVILAALAAIGIGTGLLARRQANAVPHLLGVVEPGKARRRRARRRRIERVTRLWHRAIHMPRGGRRR